MRLTTRIATTFTALMLAATGLATATSTAANAATDSCRYPPGQNHCHVTFGSGQSYKPGTDVHFYTSRGSFHHNEWVHGSVKCDGYAAYKVGPFEANDHGAVSNAFKIHKNIKPGTQCTLTLTGNQGEVLVGSFTVKGGGGTAGQFRGGAIAQGSTPSSSGTTLSKGTQVLGLSVTKSAPSASGLPFTGGAWTIPMTLAGILMLFAGASIMLMVRRRRATASSLV